MSDVKTIDLKPTTLELALKLEPHVTIVDDKLEIAKDAFEQTLPEGLDIKTVKAVQSHVNTFEAAANIAVGTVAIAHFQANPDSNALIGSTKVGHDTYNVAIARTQSVSAGVGAGRKDVPGNITSGIKSSNGEAKRSVTHVRNLAEVLRANQN